MKKYEILEAFSELKENSNGEINDADFNEFAMKYNLAEWEGDFREDLVKHKLIKYSMSKEYSTKQEFENLYAEKEKEIVVDYQKLKGKGLSDIEILTKIEEKRLETVLRKINAETDEYLRNWDMDEGTPKTTFGFIWQYISEFFKTRSNNKK